MHVEQIAAVKARDERDVQIFSPQPITRGTHFSRRDYGDGAFYCATTCCFDAPG
jgi:hypothetical protein